ncbi:MAG: alpha/beta fold hydrolase [Anaerolineae bacterium]
MDSISILSFIGTLLLMVLGAIAVFMLYLTLRPLDLAQNPIPAKPATSYEDALNRISTYQAQDSGVCAECHSIALTHGQQVERAVVFFHGYTNCPEQFRILGERLHAQGYNVWIPRMPYHGLSDRMNDEHRQITARQLMQWGSDAIDIAQGLGKQVSVAGISGGGILTAWIAQTRSDVALALAIAPTFSYRQIPKAFVRQLTNFALTLPNLFVWWNPKLREQAPGPQYGYPRFATHAVAEVLRLGLLLRQLARSTKPAAASIIVTMNPNDLIVDDALVNAVVADWRAHGARVETYTFGAELAVGHDIIDPHQPDQQTEVIYPTILRLLSGN